MVKVRVPASTANIGPGFDCLGIALNLYNTAEFELTDSGLNIEILDNADFIPLGENNFVYCGFKKVFDEAHENFNGVNIKLKSNIPVTRGLGSSSASIVLGLMGANRMLGDRFSKSELLYMANEIEGHPDNVCAALMGGFTIAVKDGMRMVSSKSIIPDNLTFAAMIPDFYLATKKSRGILPKYINYKNAAFNVAHAAILASCVEKGDFSMLSVAVKDRMHQKYRFSKIKSAEFIIRSSRRFGALCGYLSGAGPTIISIVDHDPDLYEKQMKELIRTNLSSWHLEMLKADNKGAIYLD